MARREIGTSWDRENRNNINENFKELYDVQNRAIDNANAALRNSEDAVATAGQALANSENTQAQLDQIVIEGDSSVEAAQARVDADGNVFTTLKERLDTKEQSFSAQLAETSQDIGATKSSVPKSLWDEIEERGFNLKWLESSISNKNVVSDPSFWDWTIPLKKAIQHLKELNTGGINVPIVIPSGKYIFTEKLTIYTWMKFKPLGYVELRPKGIVGEAIELTNDSSYRQSDESNMNHGWNIDGSEGGITLRGDGTVGSVGIKHGGGETGYYSAFSGMIDVRISHFDVGLQIKPVHYFSVRYSKIKINNCRVAVGFTDDVRYNAGELISFDQCFFNNNEIGLDMSVEFVKLSFSNGSISFNKKPIQIRANKVMLDFSNFWFEKWGENPEEDWLIKSFGDYYQSVVSMSNVFIYFKNYYDKLGDHKYHQAFKGKFTLNIENLTLYSDKVELSPNHQYLCDDDVRLLAGKIVYVNDNNQVIVPSKHYILNTNPFSPVMEDYTPANAHTGLETSTTTVYGASTSSLRILDKGIKGYKEWYSKKFPINPGDVVECVYLLNFKELVGGTVGHFFKYFDSDGNVISQSAIKTTDKYDSKRGLDEWFRSAVACDLNNVAPPGTKYVQVHFVGNSSFSGNVYMSHISLFKVVSR